MKKTIKAIIAVCFVFCLILAFTACYNQCSHTYDNSCDSKCNVCGSIRATAHTPDADDDDCTTEVTCIVCHVTVIPAKTKHIAHADDGDCTTSVNCTECAHICIQAKNHDFTGEYLSDVDGHWRICDNDGCYVTENIEEHIPNIESATKEAPKKCTICNYIIEAQLPHTCSYTILNKNATHHWYECTCGNIDESTKTAHNAAYDHDCTTDDVCSCGYTVIAAKDHVAGDDDGNCTTDIKCKNCDKTAKSGNQNHVDTDGDYLCDNEGCRITVGTPPEENNKDDIVDALVKIEARPDFAFRYDLTNSASGEASPIENDYYLSAYKVTNAQYAVFVSETGHKAPSYWKNGTYPEGKADHPVLNVSYSDAIAYCEWLSAKYDDWSFRLPTEAEWENAAMGEYYNDNTVKYPIGNETPSYDSTTGTLSTSFNFNGVIAAKLLREYGSNYVVTYIKGDFAGTSETLGECISISKNGGVTNWANHGGNATKGYFLQTDLYAAISANGGYTTPVGSYAPNSLGLYDMAGNCWDITSSVIIAQNGLEKDVSCYAVRGGSWYATARSCTFYYRGEGRKDSASATVGFRIAANYIGNDQNDENSSVGTTDSKFEKKQYSQDSVTLNYWLYTPKNATENMPLMVYLHGGSGKGDDLELITSVDGFPQYLKDGKITPNAYVIIPQVSSAYRGWGEIKTDVMKLISSVTDEYQIDSNRISLTGHSMGGTGVWMLALAYPDTFSAVAPLSGSVNLTDANIEKLKNMPIWAVVGTADKIVDPQASIDFITELSKVNQHANITELEGIDHFTVPSATYLSNDFDIISWLISKTKQSN